MATEQRPQEQLDKLLAEINATDGDDRIPLLRAALPLAQGRTELWAALSVELGYRLSNSLLGSRAQNVEGAIVAFQAALLVYTREQYGEEWATTQNNLGIAYANRLQGERAQNVEGAINAFRAALLVYTREQYAREWATTQNNLGDAYRVRLRGERAQNIEEAIVAFQAALLVCSHEQYAEEWAVTQNNLGNAYANRLHGDRAQNIEQAIVAYHNALSVYTREQYGADWAMVYNNLGNVYRIRLHGERAQNIEQAIAAYHNALSVRTREQYARDWATTQNNLGIAYADRLRGERSQNIEEAIAAFQAALLVRTREQYAADWATTQSNLGIAYTNRLRGERSQNIEEAIAAFQAALLVYTHEQYAEDWAMVQNNLGNAYANRLRGERAQNIEGAITAFQAALQVSTRKQYGEDWARTQNNLGNVYRIRLRGERAQNTESAIAAFQAALQVRTRERYAKDWATTQNNLGNAYADRLYGERAQNIEEAIAAYQQALMVRTREQYAEDWATTQDNLGIAYLERLRGEPAQNSENAIIAFQAALLVRTREQYAQGCRDTSLNLGHLLYKATRYSEARAAYQEAHESLKLIREETVREESRSQLAKESALLYERLIHCCLELQDYAAAATYALSGKSRSLTERLAADDAQALDRLVEQDTTLAAEWEPVRQLQAELDDLLATLGLPPGSGDLRPAVERQTAIWKEIGALRQTINQRTDTLLFRYPALAAVQPLPPFSAAQAQALAGELGEVPLVEYVRHAGGWGAFVVLPTSTPYVPLAPNLAELLQADVKAILDDTFWRGAGPNALAATLARLHGWLIAPLQRHLPREGALVLAPTQLLHLVPFQALRSATGSYLGQDYALSFVPSLATLRVLHEQRRQAGRTDAATAHHLLSVAHPGDPTRGEKYLDNVLPEAKAVRAQFTEAVQLLEADALPERMYTAARQPFGVVHIGCHGSFNAGSPLDSALHLAQGTRLSVNDVRLRLRLRGHPLVTLSACQTGQIQPEQGDEAIGLSWAFLAAGASAVVASQWSVPDDSTRQLFEFFYQQRQQARMSEAEALRRAIIQLCQRKEIYAHKPYHWAAFQVMGLPVPTT